MRKPDTVSMPYKGPKSSNPLIPSWCADDEKECKRCCFSPCICEMLYPLGYQADGDCDDRR